EQISDTIVTTTTTITTPTIEPRTAQRHGTKLKDIGAFIQSVTGCLAALGPITGTVLCWCGIRCYRNGGECKSAWWYPKTLNEYRRRRDAARELKFKTKLNSGTGLYGYAYRHVPELYLTIQPSGVTK
ncbi:unnamed protein product, partial [Didymodactylos carnosus]